MDNFKDRFFFDDFFGQFLDFFWRIATFGTNFGRIFGQSLNAWDLDTLDPFQKLSELWIEIAYFYPYD